MTLTALDLRRLAERLATYEAGLRTTLGGTPNDHLIATARRGELRSQIMQALIQIAGDDAPEQLQADLHDDLAAATDQRDEAVFRLHQQQPHSEAKLTVEKFTDACEFIAGQLNTLSEQIRDTAAHLAEQNAEKEKQIAALDNAQN